MPDIRSGHLATGVPQNILGSCLLHRSTTPASFMASNPSSSHGFGRRVAADTDSYRRGGTSDPATLQMANTALGNRGTLLRSRSYWTLAS
ncbi:hypothetical protein BD310DRAFT_911143 [Dichomitus squalens]|uniref:Uncharacterized protein n=1 Tax=Dichomitus squalens TaxID=114155 RepID=A0A4Q9QCA0_9APHY|nr:hypothetical protein BD310DRAFT_911143 [Dichomitus squalens]